VDDPRRAGFGLLEAILALAIAGLVLAAVTEIAGRALRSWNGGFATVAAVERTDLALDRIAADLSALLPVSLATAGDPDILFAGDERGMAFTAVTPFDRGNEGIAVVEIGVEGTSGGAVLTRRLRRGRDAALRSGDRVVLLSGALDLGFSYRDQAGLRVNRWTRPGEVPRGVIVTLKGPRGGGGLPVEVMLPIPVAISVSCLADTAAREPTEAAQRQEASGAGRPPPHDPSTGQPSIETAEPTPQAEPSHGPRRCATGSPAKATRTERPPVGSPPIGADPAHPEYGR
jgi:general secretion pathway protein J